VIVEQFVHMALANTDRAYVLVKGRVAMEGVSKRLLDSPELLDAYLGEGSAHDAPDGRSGKRKPAVTANGGGR
jgi:branched-chain amino acid transport system ATP-binding protein